MLRSCSGDVCAACLYVMPGIRQMNQRVSSTAARILDRERFLPRKPRESIIAIVLGIFLLVLAVCVVWTLIPFYSQ